jgi:hypothetical protein
MKTKEERAADKAARTIAMLTGKSAARPTEPIESPKQAPAAIAGLKLSDIQLKPLDFFHDHPDNQVFNAAKEADPNYWPNLKRDIREARAIINPVITLPDGTLIEGHSRIKIARELLSEGLDLGKIPTRIVASKITPEEVKQRVYLGNLSRFELDENTRLALYAQVWPDYFLTSNDKGGRPSTKPYHRDTVSTAPKIAAATGKSEVQTKRDRATVLRAAELAKGEGKIAPEAIHIAAARAETNEKRRISQEAPAGSKASSTKVSKAKSPADIKVLRATIERQIKQLEKQINVESAKAAASTKTSGKQSKDYLTGHVEGLTEALILAHRLYDQVKKEITR